MKKLVGAAVLTLSALAFTAGTASAAIVCNDRGDCWHVKKKYHYNSGYHVHVYPDNWRWANADAGRYHWREHSGRGYWNGAGVWINF